MKKRVIAAVSLTAIIAMSGCRPKNPVTVPVKTVDTVEVVDTVVEPVWDVDTTEDAVFEEVDLEAKRDSIIREHLKTVHFEYNSYVLTAESQQLLQTAAKFLISQEKGIRLKVEGHTDERGSTDYNLALGEKRAAAVREYLVRFGVEAFRVEITSYGKEKLVEYGCAGEDCHFKNRRAEYVVIK